MLVCESEIYILLSISCIRLVYDGERYTRSKFSTGTGLSDDAI